MAIVDFLDQMIALHGLGWMIGQGFGILAMVLGFVSYQVRTQRQILFCQSLVAVLFCIHYCLIGAYSAMAMNIISIIRNIAYDYRTRKGIASKLIPIGFVIIQVFMCILTWEAWYSIFILIGIGINTYCMSFSNPQNVRKSILVTSPFVLAYDILAHSVGGSIYELIAIISAAIGILRYRTSKNDINHS